MASRSYSLSTRLLVVTTIVLVLGFAATIVLLDNVFRRTSESAIRELLDVQELSTVVVKGKALRDESGNLTILASGVYVRK